MLVPNEVIAGTNCSRLCGFSGDDDWNLSQAATTPRLDRVRFHEPRCDWGLVFSVAAAASEEARRHSLNYYDSAAESKIHFANDCCLLCCRCDFSFYFAVHRSQVVFHTRGGHFCCHVRHMRFHCTLGASARRKALTNSCSHQRKWDVEKQRDVDLNKAVQIASEACAQRRIPRRDRRNHGQTEKPWVHRGSRAASHFGSPNGLDDVE